MDQYDQCQVCFEFSKDSQVFYAHYGVICCMGCKAFFRRVVRQEKTAKLICRRNGKCDMKQMKRTRCKKCRFLQCQKVGLDPAKVLGEEERKKYTHPRKNKRKMMENSENSEEMSENVEAFGIEEDRKVEPLGLPMENAIQTPKLMPVKELRPIFLGNFLFCL